ncbi:hypothetical protein [Persephonella sp.]
MVIGKFKHDLNSFIFKMETSAHLLKDPENLTYDEIKTISDIILQNTDMLRLFFDSFTLLEKLKSGEYSPKRKKIMIDDMNLVGDPKIMEYLIKIIKKLNKSPALVVEPIGNKILFQGKFRPENQIEEFFVDFLKEAVEFNKLEIKISEDEILIQW